MLEGGVFGSTEIVFRPGQLLGGQFYADTESAGAICLLGEIKKSFDSIAIFYKPVPVPIRLNMNTVRYRMEINMITLN